jgi:SpoVK/Ycf46/Vps4 family AAA+-type ATPase
MVEDRNPNEILESVLRDLRKAEKQNSDFDEQKISTWRENLEVVQRQISDMGSEGLYKQTGVILGKDKGSGLAVVAGEGSMRFEVQAKRLRPDEIKTGQAITIAPDFHLRDKTVRFQKQFLGKVGTIGRVTRVVNQDNTTCRLELSDGLIVEATDELAFLKPRPYVFVRYDPVHLIAFELIPEETVAGGQVGEIIDIYTVWDQEGNRSRRLHLRVGGGEGLLVEISPGMEKEEFGIGDLVRVDTRALLALERLKTHELAEMRPEEIGDISYNQIGGLSEVVEDIRSAIEWPYLYPQVYRSYELKGTKGILLYGPPGCGKTLIAKAIASNLRTQIGLELRKPSVQAHLVRLIQVLKLYEQILKSNADVPKFNKEWRALLESLSPLAQSHLPQGWLARPMKPFSKEELQSQVKTYLLANDVSSLDTPEGEIGKIYELCDHDKDGKEKELKPNAYFINVSGPELLTMWVGETEHKIRKLFEKARRASGPYTPVIIFLDEIESMFQTRGTGISTDIEKTIVPQFLAELDGVRELRNVIVIGASNRVELIDPALLRPGRLDRKIRIARPNEDASHEILLKYLKSSLPLDGDPSEMARGIIQTLFAQQSYLQITNKQGEKLTVPLREFVSGAILESIVTRAKKAAAEKWIHAARKASCLPEDVQLTGSGNITHEGLLEALKVEFEENREHFAVNLMDTPERGRKHVSIEDLTVTIQWAVEASDPWQELPPRISDMVTM